MEISLTNIFFKATTGVAAMGSIMGYSSPAGAILTRNSTDSSLYLTTIQNSWFSSMSNFGAMIGCPIAGFSIYFLGRRGTIIYSTIPLLIGWIIIMFAQNFEMLVIGRFITGIYCSLISTAVPTYTAEYSSPHIRGKLGILFQVMVTTGIVIAYILGDCFNSFRWIAAICAILPCLCSLLMIPNKETPLYLLSKGKETEARKALLYFRGECFQDIEIELEEMKLSLEYKKQKLGFSSIRRRHVTVFSRKAHVNFIF
ncbi:Sugar transporter ERD6-like 6 [Armadillidium vulgare]|nr:Sugar transporter ERD6-like 6 [Armadillidium vulgare]